MLADEFENFRNMCLEIHKLDPVNFMSAPGLAWQAVLKNTKLKLDLFNGINMLLAVENAITGRICYSI